MWGSKSLAPTATPSLAGPWSRGGTGEASWPLVALLIRRSVGCRKRVRPPTQARWLGLPCQRAHPHGATVSPHAQSEQPVAGPRGHVRRPRQLPVPARLDTVGWVATGSALYRTSDAGHTWSDVPLPTGVKPDAAVSLDADTVVFAYGTSPVTIASTHDAGASWVQASIDDPLGAYPVLTFRTPAVGNATFYDVTDATLGRLRIYHTTDGGRTWTGPVVSTMPDGGAKLSPVLGSSVLSFSVGKADNQAVSTIASGCRRTGARRGRHARSQPTPPCPTGTLKDVFGIPWVQDDGTLVVPISDIDHDNLYASDDNGHSWRLIKVLPNIHYGWRCAGFVRDHRESSVAR